MLVYFLCVPFSDVPGQIPYCFLNESFNFQLNCLMCAFFFPNVSERSQPVLQEPQQGAAMVAENSEVMIKPKLKQVKDWP